VPGMRHRSSEGSCGRRCRCGTLSANAASGRRDAPLNDDHWYVSLRRYPRRTLHRARLAGHRRTHPADRISSSDPLVSVTVAHRFDSVLDGLLYGWAANPNGANDGWRGLVSGVREFAPGYEAEFLTWVRAEDVKQRATSRC
jgi:hypothetical protein